MTTIKTSSLLRAKWHRLPVSLYRRGSSHRSALWESEMWLVSVSFMIVQSKTRPARVLNVFPIRTDGKRVVNMLELTPWGQGKGKSSGPCKGGMRAV